MKRYVPRGLQRILYLLDLRKVSAGRDLTKCGGERTHTKEARIAISYWMFTESDYLAGTYHLLVVHAVCRWV